MSDIEDDFKGVLDQFEDAQKGKSTGVSEEVRAEDAWVARYDELRRKVIRPTMENLGAQLQKRGHDVNIVEQQFRRDNRAIPMEASIRMDIYLATERTRTSIGMDRRPHVAFTTHHRSQMVQVFVCDMTSQGGVISKIADLPLEKIDAIYVKDKFVTLFNRLMKR